MTPGRPLEIGKQRAPLYQNLEYRRWISQYQSKEKIAKPVSGDNIFMHTPPPKHLLPSLCLTDKREERFMRRAPESDTAIGESLEEAEKKLNSSISNLKTDKKELEELKGKPESTPENPQKYSEMMLAAMQQYGAQCYVMPQGIPYMCYNPYLVYATGRLKFFDQYQNYGFFILDSDGTDVFVHYEELWKANFSREFLLRSDISQFRFGFRIMVYYGKYDLSRKAVDVHLLY